MCGPRLYGGLAGFTQISLASIQREENGARRAAQGSADRASTLAAQMKSFSDSPPIACVL